MAECSVNAPSAGSSDCGSGLVTAPRTRVSAISRAAVSVFSLALQHVEGSVVLCGANR